MTALPGRSFYVPRLAPRYFLPLACTFYALLGWGAAELGRRAKVAGIVAGGVVLSVALAGLLALMPGRVATDQYVSLVDTLRAHEHPQDRVLLYPDEDWPLFAARYPGSWEKVPAGMDLTPENVPALLAPIWESVEGLWVVSTPKAQETDPQGLIRAWLEAHAGRAHRLGLWRDPPDALRPQPRAQPGTVGCRPRQRGWSSCNPGCRGLARSIAPAAPPLSRRRHLVRDARVAIVPFAAAFPGSA